MKKSIQVFSNYFFLVHGGWFEFIPYGLWSECSASCNKGTKSRIISRNCSQPAPLYGGLPCKGKRIALEIQPCNTGLCKGYNPFC
jgi:hypothetical protein